MNHGTPRYRPAVHRHLSFLLGSAAVLLLLGSSPAGAGLMGHYYDFPANHGDIEGNTVIDGAIVPGLLNATLPGSGFPTLTALGASRIHDFNWFGQVAGTHPMTHTFDRLDADLNFGAFSDQWYPLSNGTNGPYRAFAAYWTGTASVAATADYNFAVKSDDDFWLFVDNQLVLDNGGVHAPTAQNYQVHLTGGAHTVNAFFAQRHQTQSELALTTPEGVTFGSVTPEPGGLTLLGLGLLALPLVLRHRRG